MAYTYESSYHHTPHKMECDDLAEAIRIAATDFELGEAWPDRIVGPDGAVIWEGSGPLTTGGTLKKLAQEHGVKWPE